MHRTSILATTTAAAALLAPAAAQAASKPTVSLRAPTAVQATSARLQALVNPRGQSTTYQFQIGTSRNYGTTTPVAPAGDGTRAIRATADIGALKANTTYHVRVVASNASGVTASGDRTFKTDKVPLSLSLAATPNPVPYGAPTTLTGVLAGTGGGGKRIRIEQNAFPYTAGFAPLGNPVVTNPDGSFSFPVLGLLANAQFRARTLDGKQIVTAPIIAGVAPIVKTAVSTTRPRRGSLVRFAGSVTPRFVPAQVAIQKKTSTGRWVTIAGTITRAYGDAKAKYARRVRVPRGGTYRVFVGLADSRFAGSTGPEIRLRTR